MNTKLEQVLPGEIEKRSFEIITKELGNRAFPKELEPIIKRVIHTTADFDYADSLVFSPQAVERAKSAIREGVRFITDTNMGKAGINRAALERLQCRVDCFMADEEVAAAAKRNGTTRAYTSMNRAAALEEACIFAIGNAPTALARIYELIREGILKPRLVIGVPVGFVNVIQSKELILSLPDTPFIVARGRKGGSNVAAAICNALLYQCLED